MQNAPALISSSNSSTMSSREIAELTGKELSHVHRDIKSMMDELIKDDPKVDYPDLERDSRGYIIAIHLNRELTDTLLTGYSVLGYAKLNGAKVDIKTAAHFGRLAAAQSKKLGVMTGTCPDPRFGSVGTYHSDILDAVFGENF